MRHPVIRSRALVRWLAWAARPVPPTWLLALFALWLVLSAGDVLSTALILRCGANCGRESNPLAEWLWLRGGVVALALDKLTIALVLVLVPGVWALHQWLGTPRLALCGC